MLTKKIINNFLHNIQLASAALMNLNPDATLKGSITLSRNKEFDLFQLPLRITLGFPLHHPPSPCREKLTTSW